MPTGSNESEHVKESTDLVRLIGEQVALKPRGKEFVGLCPFHNDKSPSMYVSPVKQIFKCYACGAGGDAYSFVMNYHKLSFPEAIKYLAERAGIRLEDRRSRDHTPAKPGEPTKQDIAEANSQAIGYYRAMLKNPEQGRTARDYIHKRGISPEMVEAFQLGYAPDGWDHLAGAVRSRKWNLKAFEAAGLVSPRNNGPGHYDRLRHRLIFPIFDAIGRPIAFGGRKIRAEDEPKYLNSPETPIFNKSTTLYGLHLAKKPIMDARTAVIVEGYTDVIACHQAGARNVVATLGTALTPQHVRHLRHFCDKVVLVYDGDAAGLNASDKAVGIFLDGELDVAIAVIPGGQDPAELFETPDGVERWHQAIQNARDALDYQFDRVRQKLRDAPTLTGRQKTIEEYLGQLVAHGITRMSPVRRVFIIQRVAELVGAPVQEIDGMIRRLGASARPVRSEPQGPLRPDYLVPPEDFEAPPSEDPGPMRYDPAMMLPSQPGHPGNPGQPVGAGAGHGPDPAAVLPPHRLRALEQAERDWIGCLVLNPKLFHDTHLADGRNADEAIGPWDMHNGGRRRLYEVLYDLLADHQPVSMQGVLSELAARDAHDLSALLTSIEEETERLTLSNPEKLAQRFLDAGNLMLACRAEMDKISSAGSFLPGVSEPKIGGLTGNHLQRIEEAKEKQGNAGASGFRIARIRKERLT